MRPPTFARPSGVYDALNEAQFRRAVEEMFQQVIEELTGLPHVANVSLDAGQTDDLAVAHTVKVLRVTGVATSALTGIANGSSGRTIRIVNVGTENLLLEHEETASAEPNRLLSPTGADITLGANDCAELLYDATTQRWRVVSTLT